MVLKHLKIENTAYFLRCSYYFVQLLYVVVYTKKKLICKIATSSYVSRCTQRGGTRNTKTRSKLKITVFNISRSVQAQCRHSAGAVQAQCRRRAGQEQGRSRAGQGRAGQGRAGQSRAGQGRAEQGRAGQGRAGQGRAGQGRAGQEQGRAGAGQEQGRHTGTPGVMSRPDNTN